jgi:hypothetical protein
MGYIQTIDEFNNKNEISRRKILSQTAESAAT